MTEEQAARLDALDDGAGTRYAGRHREATIDTAEPCESCARPMNEAAEVNCPNLNHAGDCVDCGARCTAGGSCPKCDADEENIDEENAAANLRRANAAESAVDGYIAAMWKSLVPVITYRAARRNEDADTLVCDLIGDLRHFCDREGIDFDEALARGTFHYEEEKAGR